MGKLENNFKFCNIPVTLTSLNKEIFYSINYLIMKKLAIIKVLAYLVIFTGLTAFMFPLNSQQKDFPTEKFTKVSISVKSTVYIEQGENYKLDIKTDDNTLEKISVKFKSDELQIECKKGCKIDEAVIINITAPTLNAISLAGSSELFIQKTFETDQLDLSLAGSGKMNMNDLKAGKLSASVAGSGKLAINQLISDKVSASVAGSGNIMLKGGTQGSVEDFSIAGSGNIDASEFKAAVVKVEIAGSGDCRVFAVEKLDISIAGSGNVYYKGKPEIKKETAGSGSIKQIGTDSE
jgi:hypothetical protein